MSAHCTFKDIRNTEYCNRALSKTQLCRNNFPSMSATSLFPATVSDFYAFTCAGITVVGEEVTEWSFCLSDAAGTGSPLTANISEGSLHSAARIGSRLREACTDSSTDWIGRGRFLAF